MAIRNAWIADCENIRNLLEQLGYPQPIETVKDKLEKLLASSNDEVYVYTIDNKAVAVITLHYSVQLAFEGDFCEIGYFVTDQHHRSSNIGKQLEAHACHEARQRGCDRIHLLCMEQRTEAHRFYQRQGYTAVNQYFEKILNKDNF